MEDQIQANNKLNKNRMRAHTHKNSNGKSAEAKNTKNDPQPNQKSNKR